jgi:hypothetical protein
MTSTKACRSFTIARVCRGENGSGWMAGWQCILSSALKEFVSIFIVVELIVSSGSAGAACRWWHCSAMVEYRAPTPLESPSMQPPRPLPRDVYLLPLPSLLSGGVVAPLPCVLLRGDWGAFLGRYWRTFRVSGSAVHESGGVCESAPVGCMWGSPKYRADPSMSSVIRRCGKSRGADPCGTGGVAFLFPMVDGVGVHLELNDGADVFWNWSSLFPAEERGCTTVPEESKILDCAESAAPVACLGLWLSKEHTDCQAADEGANSSR